MTTTSGDESSGDRKPTPDECVDAYMELQGLHLDSIGYPRPVRPFEPRLIDTSPETVRGLDIEELSDLALELANAAYAVGDEYNRQKSKIEHCQRRIAALTGNRLDHSIYASADKWMKAAYSNPEAYRLWHIKQNAVATAARLEGQAARLSELTKVINNIIFSRR